MDFDKFFYFEIIFSFLSTDIKFLRTFSYNLFAHNYHPIPIHFNIKEWPPYYKTMVSALFHHISIPEKVSTLLQHYGVCLFPPYYIIWKMCQPYSTIFHYQNNVCLITALWCLVYSRIVCLIPTYVFIEISVCLNTALKKSVYLVHNYWCPPYYSIFQYSKSVGLILEICPPYYRR